MKSQISYSMKSKTSSKTITICEKPSASDLLNNTSQCSCEKCDSYRCFAFRNRTTCSCKRCCRLVQKISKNSVRIVESITKEHFKKQITYDDSRDNMKKQSTISNIHPRQDSSFDTAKLTAQIMNVPYNELKQSISHNMPVMTRKTTNLTKLDIFKRIKEAYEACSCKVCECINGRSNVCSDICKCKPCQCKDCVTVLNNLKSKGKCVRYACDPVKCDKNDCKGFVRKTSSVPEHCNCDPCECFECNDSINKPCNCKPCECIECKAYSLAKPKVLIVGRVAEDNPRILCSCLPCECAECTQRALQSTPSSRRHEMSTEMSMPTNCNCDSCASQICETNDSGRCSCEIQKQVMSKPFQRDTLDYDIHRASIKNISIEKPYSKTISMFAALEDNLQNFKLFNKDCDCGNCECLICNSKNGNATVIKNARLYQSPMNIDSCDCLPCECEVCKAANIRCPVRIPKPCTCDVCDCLKCEGFIDMSSNINKNMENSETYSTCKCKHCECAVCRPNHIDNNCCRSYNEPTISSEQENIVCQDNGFIDKKPECDYSKTKIHPRTENDINNYDTEEPSASHNYSNLPRYDGSGTIKYTKTIDSQYSLTAAHDFNKMSLMNDIYKQCTEKFIPQLDTDVSHTYTGVSESCIIDSPRNNNIRGENAVTVQSNITKLQKQNDIISSHTTRRLLGGSIDNCENNITKINTKTIISKTSDNNNDKKLRNLYPDNNKITISSNNIKSSSKSRLKSGMNKSSNLQNKQKKTLNSEKNTENLGCLNLPSQTKIKVLNNTEMDNLKQCPKSESETYKEPISSNKSKSNDNASRNAIDFEKVQHSLQKAKAFSIELIKLLKQYEKANDDFCKYTKKFSEKYDIRYTRTQESEKNYAPLRTKFHHNIRTVDCFSSNSILEKDEANKPNAFENNDLKSSAGYNLPVTSDKLELIDILGSKDNMCDTYKLK